MKSLFIIFFLLCAYSAEAHVPVFVDPKNVDDLVIIEDPSLSQAFYGELEGFQHAFEIHAKEPFTLFLQILQPDIESSKNNISGIIIREPKAGGRVEEIAPLTAKDALWESVFEPFGGDTYRNGPQFEKELEPGMYRIGIHTPDNREKYVLVVGKREEMTIGYFELIRRLAKIKVFFEKSQFRIIESPYVYIPFGIFLLGTVIGWWMYYRRKYALEHEM